MNKHGGYNGWVAVCFWDEFGDVLLAGKITVTRLTFCASATSSFFFFLSSSPWSDEVTAAVEFSLDAACAVALAVVPGADVVGEIMFSGPISAGPVTGPIYLLFLSLGPVTLIVRPNTTTGPGA